MVRGAAGCCRASQHGHRLQPQMAQGPVCLPQAQKSCFQKSIWQPFLFPSTPAQKWREQTTNTAGAFSFCFTSTDLKQQLCGAIPSVKKHILFLLLFDISMDKPNVLTSNLMKYHGFCLQAGHSSLQQHMRDLSSEIEHWCYTQH